MTILYILAYLVMWFVSSLVFYLCELYRFRKVRGYEDPDPEGTAFTMAVLGSFWPLSVPFAICVCTSVFLVHCMTISIVWLARKL